MTHIQQSIHITKLGLEKKNFKLHTKTSIYIILLAEPQGLNTMDGHFQVPIIYTDMARWLSLHIHVYIYY